MEALEDPFFDELRVENAKTPDDQTMPPLFDWTDGNSFIS